MNSDRCSFCAQIEGSREHNLLYEALDMQWAVRPVLRENDSAVAMPSIGALTAGHVLISPERHLRSFAIASPEESDALERLARGVAHELGDATGLPIHGFEHGSSACGERIACSVEHAHRHLIPCAGTVARNVWNAARWAELGKSETLIGVTAGREYLSYHAPDGCVWVATTEVGFSSQLLRRVFAQALGKQETWDWRDHPATGEVAATIALFDEEAVHAPTRRRSMDSPSQLVAT